MSNILPAWASALWIPMVFVVACNAARSRPAAPATATPQPTSAAAPSSGAAAAPATDADTAEQPAPTHQTVQAAEASSPSGQAEASIRPRRVDVTRTPIDVVLGESVAWITLGMTVNEVRALGLTLAPEGVERLDRTGWVAGPLLILVDASDRVVLVSVELGATRGLRVGNTLIPPRASLAQVATLIPLCTRATGSGGDYLDCRGASGKLVHFWGTFGARGAVTMTLDQALLR